MGIEYRPLVKSISERLDRYFGKKNAYIEVNPGRALMSPHFQSIGQDILDLEIRKDDCWLLSYPRTGSTWAQEMIWLLGNNLDYEGAKALQQVRTPLLELSALFPGDVEDVITKHEKVNSVTCVHNMQSPRYVKSHLPWELLPAQMDIVRPKIIYIVRNPKDLCVSYYHFWRLGHKVSGEFDEFCELFLSDNVPYGSMWAHMLSFWNRRHQSNILFLRYEDMKRNLPVVIRECARFLEIGRQLTDQEVQQLCEHLQFDRMQRNPAVNLESLLKISDEVTGEASVKFIRKGTIGDWKNYMSDELSDRFDLWIRKHSEGTGLEFDYE